MKEDLLEFKDMYDELLKFPDYIDVMLPEIETAHDRDFKCCCPLHEEDTPSFLYSQNMDVWTCFGSCHTTGKTVKFHHLYMQKKYGQEVTLVQAMKNLQSTFAHILPELELGVKKKTQVDLADTMEKELLSWGAAPIMVPKEEHMNNIMVNWFTKDSYS